MSAQPLSSTQEWRRANSSAVKLLGTVSEEELEGIGVWTRAIGLNDSSTGRRNTLNAGALMDVYVTYIVQGNKAHPGGALGWFEEQCNKYLARKDTTQH